VYIYVYPVIFTYLYHTTCSRHIYTCCNMYITTCMLQTTHAHTSLDAISVGDEEGSGFRVKLPVFRV
jgi:hypothetical protein